MSRVGAVFGAMAFASLIAPVQCLRGPSPRRTLAEVKSARSERPKWRKRKGGWQQVARKHKRRGR